MRIRIMVFAKTPVAGRVKTRLRRVYGAHGAARVYRRLLARTLATAAAASPDHLEIRVAPGAGHPWISALARRFGARVRVQDGGNLGRRMHRALADTVRAGEAGIIIGADCAALVPEDLRQAMDALRAGQRLVIKPAQDGGYLLVGGNCAPAVLFQGIPWSTAAVMKRTRSRLRRLALPWRALETGWDVDRPVDLRRLVRECGFRLIGTSRGQPGVGTAAGGQYPTPHRRSSRVHTVNPR